MRTIKLEEARAISKHGKPTHVRFTYANHSYHEYPIEELDKAIESHKWSRLGLHYGIKLDEKCEIKNKGMATGWSVDDFIQIGETDYSWNNEQTGSPAWEYQRR